MSQEKQVKKTIFNKTRLPLIALAALPLTVGAVLAQQTGTAATGTAATGTATQAQPTPQRVQPAQPGQRQNRQGQTPQGSGTNYADVYLQKLAAQLGISLDKLRAAALAAGNATIDQGVKDGNIAGNRAADMKTRLQNDPFRMFGGRGGPGGGGRGMHGPGGRDGGPRSGPRGSLDAPDGPQGQTDDGAAAADDAATGS
ncbi:hypothetical protein [Deinococcus aerophilus]|uniref:Translation initiation factor IF-2 n=1 Tax=Deinococcus aerophilus TaxID=522488 RepID=A0ABQ2GKM1_9DEIO|nr:hypothetical protein [Deinococcus aerophilus]GGL99799.1 hypothetical protein GCM10010841_05510 [Deinococcus aerophilus]